jgi:hypothetical protein
MNQAAVERAHADQMRADNLKLNIQGDDVKFLLGRVTCLSGKLVTAELKGIDRVRDAGQAFLVFGKTRGDAPAQFDAGHDLAISGLAERGGDVL